MLYECHRCFKTFTEDKNLLRHLRRSCQFSDRIYRYECGTCHQMFTRSDCLPRHLKNNVCGRARPITQRYLVETLLPVVRPTAVPNVVVPVDDPDEPVGEEGAAPQPDVDHMLVDQDPHFDGDDVSPIVVNLESPEGLITPIGNPLTLVLTPLGAVLTPLSASEGDSTGSPFSDGLVVSSPIPEAMTLLAQDLGPNDLVPSLDHIEDPFFMAPVEAITVDGPIDEAETMSELLDDFMYAQQPNVATECVCLSVFGFGDCHCE